MTEEQKQPVAPAAQAPTQGEARPSRGGDANRDRMQMRRKNTRRTTRDPRARSEFDQKIINIRRVARVSSGGKRFSFSVAIILGNRRGSVGVGTGKGADTAIAIDKATRSAKKNMIKIMATPTMSVPHLVEAKYSSARIMIMPATGRGVVAGSAARSVLELAGIKDVTAKIISPSKNTLNIARATIAALSGFSPFAAHAKPAVKTEGATEQKAEAVSAK